MYRLPMYEADVWVLDGVSVTSGGFRCTASGISECSGTTSCATLTLPFVDTMCAESSSLIPDDLLGPFCSLGLIPPRLGFKKVKGGSSSRPRSIGGTAAGEGGAAVGVKDSESWEEFRHPQFRRGRRDLLVGIKRQKDGGRLKRKRGAAWR